MRSAVAPTQLDGFEGGIEKKTLSHPSTITNGYDGTGGRNVFSKDGRGTEEGSSVLLRGLLTLKIMAVQGGRANLGGLHTFKP